MDGSSCSLLLSPEVRITSKMKIWNFSGVLLKSLFQIMVQAGDFKDLTMLRIK